jgi:hypothetical protein
LLQLSDATRKYTMSRAKHSVDAAYRLDIVMLWPQLF